MGDPVPFQDLLQKDHDDARQHLAGAWRAHAEQVREVLEKGWQQNLAKVFDERLRALAEKLEEESQKRLSLKQAEVRAMALAEEERKRNETRREFAAELHQLARRIAQATDVEEWATALLDGLSALAETAAVFRVADGKLRSVAMRPAGPEIELAIREAPAFAGVEETLDTVVVAVTPRELSEGVCFALGLTGPGRAYLAPLIRTGDRKLSGVVLAAPSRPGFDLTLFELICALAGPVRTAPPQAAQMVAGILPATPAMAPVKERVENEELLLRARRFARVKVAELRLYQSQAVIDGRAAKKLYSGLKAEIDLARQQYQEEFPASAGTPDYLHEELVRTLANNDATLLGVDYPGALA